MCDYSSLKRKKFFVPIFNELVFATNGIILLFVQCPQAHKFAFIFYNTLTSKIVILATFFNICDKELIHQLILNKFTIFENFKLIQNNRIKIKTQISKIQNKIKMIKIAKFGYTLS